MTHTQRLESITQELYNFSQDYKNQNEIGLGSEFEDTAKAIKQLIKVYNYGYDGYELDVINKHVTQKLNSLQRVLKTKSTNENDVNSHYILGSLNQYNTIIKKVN
ncbi:MAG: hypothetical protein V4565_12045 [Bacteroidota bacterium]